MTIIPWKLRLKPSGTSCSWTASMMRLVSARSVCSSGLSPTTVTDSSMAPTSIFRSTRTVALTGTTTPSRTIFLKPLNSDDAILAVFQVREDVVPDSFVTVV